MVVFGSTSEVKLSHVAASAGWAIRQPKAMAIAAIIVAIKDDP
jgi:hypothetical protein